MPSDTKWFNEDDGRIERTVKVADFVVKVFIIVAAILAFHKFWLFQESTEIINSKTECKSLATGDKKYAEITLAVTNAGKVRVRLKSGMLRLIAVSGSDLSFRHATSTKSKKNLTLENIFVINRDKFAYPKELEEIEVHDEFLGENELFFDPGETIRMRFLVEYTGEGLCNIVARYDGAQPGSVWLDEIYVELK